MDVESEESAVERVRQGRNAEARGRRGRAAGPDFWTVYSHPSWSVIWRREGMEEGRPLLVQPGTVSV